VSLCGGELQLAVNDALRDVFYEADVDSPLPSPSADGRLALSLLQPSRLCEKKNPKMRTAVRA